jgi:hypothetical protein
MARGKEAKQANGGGRTKREEHRNRAMNSWNAGYGANRIQSQTLRGPAIGKPLMLAALTCLAGAAVPSGVRAQEASFKDAKKRARVVYADRQETFYCACDYDGQQRVDRRRCGYVPQA